MFIVIAQKIYQIIDCYSIAKEILKEVVSKNQNACIRYTDS